MPEVTPRDVQTNTAINIPTVGTAGRRVRVHSLTYDDIPSVYEQGNRRIPTVNCMVCKEKVDIRGKQRQYVVRCSQCQETTPIRLPPADKKYVRCTCNSLLICRSGALRIVCPREDCEKILDVGHNDLGATAHAGMARIICIFCDRTFLFNVTESKFAHCPHCTKRSSIGKVYAQRCGFIYMGLFAVLMIVAIVATVCTYHVLDDFPGVIAVYICLFAAVSLLILQSIYYFTIPISLVIGTF